MSRLSAFLCLICLPVLLGASPDSFSRAELEALEAEKAAAEQQLAALEAAEAGVEFDVATLNQTLIASAMESRRREEQATNAERELVDLKIRRSAATENLLRDEIALEDTLAALASASQHQPPAMIVSPGQVNRSVRTAILMSAVAPELSERADALSEEIDTLNSLERQILREQARLEAAEATLALKRHEIETLAAAKRAQYEDVSEDAARLKARADILAEQAGTLRDLLEALEREAPAAPGRKPAAARQAAVRNSPSRAPASPTTADLSGLRPLGQRELGAMMQPVTGRVSEQFGARRATGSRSEGLTIVTRQDAQVVAPVDGVIEHADVFRSYGHMLILRTSDNYRVIMAGLAETYGSPGQRVNAGEPVGHMSGRMDPPPELYLELRKNDKSENPANWLER
ncbi:MAG: peptidoglycan DD-metalloendopeptidase family protein [Hyphomonadaceae bacterium]